MEKRELINGIIDLFEELQKLEEDNKHMKTLVNACAAQKVMPSDLDHSGEFSGISNKFLTKILNYAAEHLVNEAGYHYNSVSGYIDDEGNIKVASFDKWVSNSYYKTTIPDWFSFEDFLAFCNNQLHSIYDEKKNKKIQDLEEQKKEQEGNEE